MEEPQTKEELVNNDKGVSTVVFTITIGFIVGFVLIAMIYVVLNDRLNANDAYRTKELREQRDGLKQDCDQSSETLQKVQAWIKQHPELTPPLEVQVERKCRPIGPIEKPTN